MSAGLHPQTYKPCTCPDSRLKSPESETSAVSRPRSPPFLAPGLISWKRIFPQTGWGGWFGDDLSTLHLSCTLFLELLQQLHLRESGIQSQRLGGPGLTDGDAHMLEARSWSDAPVCGNTAAVSAGEGQRSPVTEGLTSGGRVSYQGNQQRHQRLLSTPLIRVSTRGAGVGIPADSIGKEPICQGRRLRFHPWVGKIPCRAW